jgi:hypothetical protein
VRRLKVLYLAANPIGTEPLRLDEEIRSIQDRIRGARFAARLTLSSAWAVRVEDLARTLRANSPDIVHFSGHGSPDGILVENEQGLPTPVPGDALAELFHLEGRSVQAVVLNACYTEHQALGIAQQVAFVVGTWPAIGDDDAVAFSGRFYESIANGDSLGKSFTAGSNEIALRGGSVDAHRSFARPGFDAEKAVLLRPRSRWPIAATAAAAVVALGAAAWLWPRPPSVVYQNTELVFDGSLAMGEEFPTGDGKTTKKLAAQEKVEGFLRSRGPDNLALRYAGGCDVESTLAVPFQTDAADRIQRSMFDLVPAGEFPLAAAVIAATADFNDVRRFPPDDTRRQIIAVTASGDRCVDDPATVLAERWLELGTDIALNVDFIGLDVPAADADRLRDMAAAVGGRSWFPEDASQLESLLGYLLEYEPVFEATNQLVDTGNDIVEPLRDFAQAMNACDATAARDADAAADAAYAGAAPVIDDLATRNTREVYTQIHAAAATWVDRLGSELAVHDELLAFLGSAAGRLPDDDCDALRSSDRWAAVIKSQRTAVGASDEARRAFEAAIDELELQIPALPPS